MDSGLSGCSMLPIGLDLVRLPFSDVGENWPLVRPVDAIVEQQDLEIDVAAQTVDEVIGADTQPVPVAGDHPHQQIRPAQLQAGRNGRRASVYRVKAVGIHVVRKAAGTANARNKDDIFPRQLQFLAYLGHDLLNLRQDRVVAAAGTPAHLRLGDEVLLFVLVASVMPALVPRWHHSAWRSSLSTVRTRAWQRSSSRFRLS